MKVVNLIHCGYLKIGTFERIDRGTRWGNPFLIGVDGSREDVVTLYREYALWRFHRQPGWLEPLRDKEFLVCHCAPLLCHGDILVELLEKSQCYK